MHMYIYRECFYINYFKTKLKGKGGKFQPCRISLVDGRGEAQVVPHGSGSAVETPLLVTQLSANTV